MRIWYNCQRDSHSSNIETSNTKKLNVCRYHKAFNNGQKCEITHKNAYLLADRLLTIFLGTKPILRIDNNLDTLVRSMLYFCFGVLLII